MQDKTVKLRIGRPFGSHLEGSQAYADWQAGRPLEGGAVAVAKWAAGTPRRSDGVVVVDVTLEEAEDLYLYAEVMVIGASENIEGYDLAGCAWAVAELNSGRAFLRAVDKAKDEGAWS